MTLNEYGPASIWYCTVTGQKAAGETIEAPAEPEVEGWIPCGWGELTGTVDEYGDWNWDGENDPSDWNGTQIGKIVGSRD